MSYVKVILRTTLDRNMSNETEKAFFERVRKFRRLKESSFSDENDLEYQEV